MSSASPSPGPYSFSDTQPVIKDPAIASLLGSVSELMKNRLPYTAGTLELSPSAFTIYYEDKDTGVVRSIKTLEASDEDLERLTNACDEATFGRGDEDVLDKAYRTAGKLDATHFSTPLVPERSELAKIVNDFMLEGKYHKREVEMELYKLNIYGKGSFFKSHVDTPRSERMFGSLVLAFPTPHQGGELVLRPSGGTEYIFDSGSALVPGKPRVGYAAFFSDVEHEVLPVTEGHRITLTYNLYYGEPERKAITPESVTARMSECKSLLTGILRSKKVLPRGGLLCFGMKHAYPVSVGQRNESLRKAHRVLKGADQLLYVALNQLHLQTNVQLLYRPRYADDEFAAACGLSSRIIDMECREDDDSDSVVLRREGTLSTEDLSRKKVLWVTPPTGLTSIKYAFGQPWGNEISHGHIYADLCLVSRIRPYAERIKDLPDQKRKRDADDDPDSASKRSKSEASEASEGGVAGDAEARRGDEDEEEDKSEEEDSDEEDSDEY
ncbi:unnamed protein product [Peniophora sp. CBMAI 1063]|nr:unnamed protein product [Peniophora sp. CBMAI 1063]